MNEAVPIAPTRHKIDVPTFYRMGEVGLLGEQDRIELIDGELIVIDIDFDGLFA